MSSEAKSRSEQVKHQKEQNPVIPYLSKQNITLPGLRRWFTPEDAWQNPFRAEDFKKRFPLDGILRAQEALTEAASASTSVRVAVEENLSALASELVVPLVWVEWDPSAKPRAGYKIDGKRRVSVQSAFGEIEPTRKYHTSSLLLQKGDIPEGATHAPSSVFVHAEGVSKHTNNVMEQIAKKTRKVRGFKNWQGSNELLSDMLLQASANHKFHQELEAAGVKTTYPETTHTRNIKIRKAKPEHLLVLKGIEHKERRYRIAEVAINLTQPHRSGDIKYDDSHHEKIEESIRYTAERKPERLPERIPKQFFEEAIELCKRYPEKGQIANYFNTQVLELAKIFLEAESSYMPLSQEALLRVDEIRREIIHWHEMLSAEGYTKGAFWGQFVPNILEDINVEFNFPDMGIVDNDISVKAGVPMVILGANGEGKTTILAQALQHQKASGKGVSESAVLPKNVDVIAAADLLRLQGIEMMQKARSSGKSSFVLEVEQFIKRMDQILAYGEKTMVLPLAEGDEVGSKTDQLNAMALLATELIASSVKGTLSFHASHYNSLPKVIGPLFEKLGIKVDWNTMENHKLKKLKKGDDVKSNALVKSAPFLPEEFVRLWMEVSGTDYSPLEFAEDQEKMDYDEFNMERLEQLGWINRFGSQSEDFVFGGIVSELMGSKTSYSYKDYGKMAIVNTILNPRWEHVDGIPNWINELRNGVDQEVAKPLAVLNTLVKIYGDIHTFKKHNIQNDNERDRIFREMSRLWEVRDVFVSAAHDVAKLLPGFPVQRIIQAFSGKELSITDMTKFSNEIFLSINDVIALDTLLTVSFNLNKGKLKRVDMRNNGKGKSGISIKNGWNYELARNLKGEQNVVKNSIDLDETSVFFTGPQGSGKTEALFTIAENIHLGALWGLTSSDEMSIGGRYEVIPLLSIPPEPKDKWGQPKRRQLSSLERESADRIGLVVDLCRRLPKGVRPVVIMDEPYTSTNSKDAAEGAITIKRYVESLGGIIIVSTHFHDTLWRMEKMGEAFHAKQVELFGTPDQFKWTNGHGKSMGIEVAKKLGLDKRLSQIAFIIRGYLEGISDEDPTAEQVEEAARLLAPIIVEL